jgi:hypothetical protein
MAQNIQSRIGKDRDTVLDMNYRPDLCVKEWPSSALTKGKRRASNAAHEHEGGGGPVSKRAKVSPAVQRQIQDQASYKGYSGTSKGDKPFSPQTTSGSGYSPVSGAEQERSEIKTEVLIMAKAVQRPTAPQSESQLTQCPWHGPSRRRNTAETEVGRATEVHRQCDTAL